MIISYVIRTLVQYMEQEMINLKVFILLIIFSIFSEMLFAQKELYHLSNLKDSLFFLNKIRNISDEDLFCSINLDLPGLINLKESYEKGDFQNCYKEWKLYRLKKILNPITTDDDGLFLSFEDRKNQIKNDESKKRMIFSNSSKVLDHEIKGWGDVVFKFGSKIDFNANYGYSGKYGFHYWYWSSPLIDAYLASGDLKYIRCFDTLFNQWYEQRNNITGEYENFDVIFYELGLGIRNKYFLADYYTDYPDRDLKTYERMLKTFLGSGRWLYEMEKNPGYRNGNFQMVASLMLAYLGLAFPEFIESKEWIELGIQRLIEHLEKDFYDDGGHSERSPAGYTILTYLQIRNLYYILKEYDYHTPLLNKIIEKGGRTISWWISIMTPTAEMPAINDAHLEKFPQNILIDGAKIFKIPEVYGIIDALYKSHPTPDLIMPKYLSVNLPSSGFAVMRSDWTNNAFYMNINYGKFAGYHTHSDLLDFELYAFGKAHAIDAGVCRTYDDPAYFPWYKISNAHNMLVVNDSSMDRSNTEGKNITWKSMKNIDYFSALNSGYEKYGIKHIRHILFIKSGFWLIFDEIISDGRNNKITWNIHLRDSSISKYGEYFKTNPDTGLIVYPIENYMYEIKNGPANISNTGEKQDYLKIPWLQFIKSTENKKYENFSVLLFPYKRSDNRLNFRKDKSGGFIVEVENETFEIFIKSTEQNNLSVNSDADLVFISKKKGIPEYYSIINGKYLEYDGKTIFKYDKISDYEK
jgi:hypothetical protein